MSETQTPAPARPRVTGLDRFRAVTVDGVTFHVDKYGWPVETCGRCGGSGEYSYCQMYGTKCFGCQGVGVTGVGGKAGEIRAEFRTLTDAQSRLVGHSLTEGVEIRDWHAPKGTPFRRVIKVTATGKEDGRSRVGNEPEIIYYRQQVTFEDGETVEMGGWLVRGRVTVARAPYVEAAQAAYAATVKRREAAAVRRAASPPKPRKPRPARSNQFAGQCTACGTQVAAGTGTWSRADGCRHAEGGCKP